MNAAVTANGFEVRIDVETDNAERDLREMERGLLEFAVEVATDEDLPGARRRLLAFNLSCAIEDGLALEPRQWDLRLLVAELRLRDLERRFRRLFDREARRSR